MRTHRNFVLACVGALFVGFLPAAFADNLRVPSSVFRMDQLEEAKAKAIEGEEPLVFLYTNPGST